jgi:hypothetical protein
MSDIAICQQLTEITHFGGSMDMVKVYVSTDIGAHCLGHPRSEPQSKAETTHVQAAKVADLAVE